MDHKMAVIKIVNFSLNIFVIFLCLMISSSSFAALTEMKVLITDNVTDCSNAGYFHDNDYDYSGFSNCRISINENGQIEYISDVIAKFDTVENSANVIFETSTQYENDVAESDWDLSGNNNGNLSDESTGTWSYTGGYPGIRFWTAKAGNDFNLFWTVESTTVGNSCDTMFSYSCLSLAVVVTSGSWTTPTNPNNGKGKGLSHITFFNGGECTGNCGSTSVPEPTTIFIFAIALLGFIIRQRNLHLIK
jgi:hypothetical protein